MPPFLHPGLFWTLGLPTLGLVLIPVLIHLINTMRHRRVEWAAVEFLLASQKKNRTWVRLKELLLLLMRMLAVAFVIWMVAQPLLRNQWSNLLGGARTHHIVLLDDSYSMSDRWADTDAFREAKAVVERLATDAARQVEPQAFTLLRFSQVGQGQRGTQPDLLKEAVGPDFPATLAAVLKKLAATQTAAGPMGAAQAVVQLLGEADSERRIVYIISDFRARQWKEPTDLRRELQQLTKAGAQLHFVQCVEQARPNLALTALAPVDGIRAAGVPWLMEAGVANYGTALVRNVPVSLSADGHSRPAATVAEIPPGQVAKVQFAVHFPDAGQHQITARLESDAVAADNARYYAFNLPTDVPVLLIDGDPGAHDAQFLQWAFAPGGTVRTGIRPQIETPRYLSTKPLDGFRVVCLTNVDRLEDAAVRALEQFATNGGGVAFFLGNRCDARFYNAALYRDGQGLFPAALGRETELRLDRLEPAPDVQISPHFIFRVFAEQRNAMLQTVSVQRYFSTAQGWQPPADSTVQVLSRLRTGAPLIVERAFGKGRVAAFLTTAAPTWNNWARNPSFVVVMQDLLAYLLQAADVEPTRLVGAPLEISLDPAQYKPQVRFTAPADADIAEVSVDAAPTAEGALAASWADTKVSGYYEACLVHADETPETRRFAVNVDPAEGNLETRNAEQLAAGLEGVKYDYDLATAFQLTAGDAPGYNLGELLLFGLILLLLAEQLMAWSASYHLSSRSGAVRQGGAA